jgi:hypothetical protein
MWGMKWTRKGASKSGSETRKQRKWNRIGTKQNMEEQNQKYANFNF